MQELLPELNIKRVTTRAQSQIKGGREDKGIRLDIQAFDEQGRVYDIEMQLSKNSTLSGLATTGPWLIWSAC